ncbi:MAG: hypothetical protein NT169_29090 [Chloroflexi bacterium]|nr:hypothetical protein [Chloroflexota bacterium]
MQTWIVAAVSLTLGFLVQSLMQWSLVERDRFAARLFAAVLLLAGLIAAVVVAFTIRGGIVAPFVYILGAFLAALAWNLGRTDRRLTEPDIQARARELCSAANEALRHAPISPDRKASIQEQIQAVPANIKVSREKLGRLRKLQDLTEKHKGQPDKQLAQLEANLLKAMDAALDLLLDIPKSLMLVEIARDERAVASILSALSETNKRMTDLADAHAEMARLDGRSDGAGQAGRSLKR